MAAIFAQQYPKDDIQCISMVHLHQHFLFLLDMLDARGNAIDLRYITPQQQGVWWSSYNFPKECPPPQDFRLWCQAVFWMKAEWRLHNRIGTFLHPGHKLWDWQYYEQATKLLHIKGNVMDVYTQLQFPCFLHIPNC